MDGWFCYQTDHKGELYCTIILCLHVLVINNLYSIQIYLMLTQGHTKWSHIYDTCTYLSTIADFSIPHLLSASGDDQDSTGVPPHDVSNNPEMWDNILGDIRKW